MKIVEFITILAITFTSVQCYSRPCGYIYSEDEYFLQSCSSCDNKKLCPLIYPDVTTAVNMSNNPLGHLTKADLTIYSKLHLLLLINCSLTEIEDGAFVNFKNLTILDISMNKLMHLSPSVFALKKLTTVRLYNNLLTNNIFGSIAIAAPINILDMSDNKLEEIPKFQSPHKVSELHLFNNAIRGFNIKTIASFCSLHNFNITNNPLRFDGCECEELKRWMIKKIKHINGLECPEDSNCPETVYKQCTIKVAEESKRYYGRW